MSEALAGGGVGADREGGGVFAAADEGDAVAAAAAAAVGCIGLLTSLVMSSMLGTFAVGPRERLYWFWISSLV